MKVFVDECVNKRLLRHLTGHAFTHISDTPLRSTKNGALLRAVAPDYDVFLTCDASLAFQQNLRRFTLAFIVMRAHSHSLSDLLPLVPDVLAALARIEAGGPARGELYEVTPE